MVELMGYSTLLVNTSNFSPVSLATFDDKGMCWFGDVSTFQIVDETFLRSLQYASDGFTVEQKMNWLVNRETSAVRPYWTKGTSRLYFGTIVFGGQKVQVEAVNGAPVTYTRQGKYKAEPAGIVHDIDFYRVLGLRRSQFGDVLSGTITHESHPHLIQRATEAWYPTDRYNEYPRGEIFHPVWSDEDWKANEHDGKLYIATALLE